ncbi:MAG: hypothetical protein LBB79_05310 [Prevotellaceae bacterium]|jgi:hypothetical protein|nr:hypothetical protein [Prevotellaceae bacterium]
MKKTITTLCLACLAGGTAAAQTSVRIGSLEITFRKNDTTYEHVAHERLLQVNPPKSDPKPQRSPYYKSKSTGFIGFGFAVPGDGSGYYAVRGGNSYNFDLGCRWYTHFNSRLAAGGTFQYSFYHYRLKDALSDSVFRAAVIGSSPLPYAAGEIKKQAFRSNNLALGVFTRFYLIPKKHYLDLGVQGDWAFSRFYKLYYPYDGKQNFHEDDMFNAFTASAVAQIGWESFAIFARYRLTDAFSGALPKDLPALSIGIRLE